MADSSRGVICPEQKGLLDSFFSTVDVSSVSGDVLASKVADLKTGYNSWDAKYNNARILVPNKIEKKKEVAVDVLEENLKRLLVDVVGSSLLLPVNEEQSIAMNSLHILPVHWRKMNFKKFGVHMKTHILCAAAAGVVKSEKTTYPDMLEKWSEVVVKQFNSLKKEYNLQHVEFIGTTGDIAGSIDCIIGEEGACQVKRGIIHSDEEDATISSTEVRNLNKKSRITDAKENTDVSICVDNQSRTSLSHNIDMKDEDISQVWYSGDIELTGTSRHCINLDKREEMQIYQFQTMGYIDSCFKLKYGTPRQGSVVPTSRACLTLHYDITPDSVAGLLEYSHCWLVFVFHYNAQSKYKPKICPPRLHGTKVGCLATRTPHRWNDIGLSLVKIDRIEVPKDFAHLPKGHPKRQFLVHNSKLQGCARIFFSGIDLVDGTPILDIKPFHPSDVPTTPYEIPKWLAEAPLSALQVTVSSQALLQLNEIFEQYFTQTCKLDLKKEDQVAKACTGELPEGQCVELYEKYGSPMQFYRTRQEILEAVKTTLSMDPRPICTKKRHADSAIYGFMYDSVNVIYRMVTPLEAQISIIELSDADRKKNRKRELMNQREWLDLVRSKLDE